MCWSNSHIFLLRPHNCSRSPRPCVPGLCGSGTSVQHRRRRPSILPVVASTAADPELPAQTAAGATAPRGLLHTERHVRPPAAASLASAVTSVSCAEQVSDGIRIFFVSNFLKFILTQIFLHLLKKNYIEIFPNTGH